MTEVLPYFSCKLVLNSVRAKTRTINGGGAAKLRPVSCVATEGERSVVVKNGKDSLDVCRVVNGMWQTSGGWGKIDRDNAVDAMLRYTDAGLATFDMADIYGPAEDLYGIFINRVRRERPPELLEKVRGLTKWVPSPVKMTRSYVERSIDVSRKRMDVACLDMLQFHWWDYANPGYLDALKHLTDLKDEGKIKTVALTNFDTERYGTVMGGLLSEKFLDTNITIPFVGPSLKTPSLQKYKRPAVAGSMIGVRLGLSEHIKDANAIFSLVLDEEDVNSISEVSKRGKDLMTVIGDCGDEYRRA
ncbi:hypothetical protein RDABS01_024577 [Bienertia sinuspersici]